jgi:hypothetical protein
MKNKKPTDDDFEGISALVRKEEEDALAFFRTRNFRGRVMTSLETDKKQADLSRRMAFPALTAVLILIVAGVVALVLNRPGRGPAPEFRSLATALAQLPGFSPSQERERGTPSGQAGISRLAESVGQVLTSAEKIKGQEEQEISIPAGPLRVPRLSLDQKMEILFKEKTIERVLLMFKDNSKEG